MRAATHEVSLPGGRLVLPLTMRALRLLALVPANPLKPEDGCVDPAKVLRGEQDLATVTVVDCLHTLADTKSPGADALFGYGNQSELVTEMVRYCIALAKSMGPEKAEEPSPKE